MPFCWFCHEVAHVTEKRQRDTAKICNHRTQIDSALNFGEKLVSEYQEPTTLQVLSREKELLRGAVDVRNNPFASCSKLAHINQVR